MTEQQQAERTIQRLQDMLANCMSARHAEMLEDGCTHEEMADIYQTAFERAEKVAQDAIAELERLKEGANNV